MQVDGDYTAEFPELKRVQQVELDILKKFDAICTEMGLTYFLDSGTALGAVRHEGFIPWDDDIDVGMPRKDYDIFMQIGQEKLGDGFFLQNRITDPKSPFSFAKIRKNNTVFLEWNKRNIDMNHGIFIDIFPYDILPESGRDEYIDECRKLNLKLARRTIPDRAMRPEKNIKWWIGAACRRLAFYLMRFSSIKKIDRQIIEAYSRFDDAEYEGMSYVCHAFSKKVTFEESILFPVKRATFEGYQFNIPAKSRKYLTLIYGEYMELPPIEDRVGHRPAEIILEGEKCKQ